MSMVLAVTLIICKHTVKTVVLLCHFVKEGMFGCRTKHTLNTSMLIVSLESRYVCAVE